MLAVHHNIPRGPSRLEAVKMSECIGVGWAADHARVAAIGVADEAALRSTAIWGEFNLKARSKRMYSPRLSGLNAMESAERSGVSGAGNHPRVLVVRSGVAYNTCIERRVARDGNGSSEGGRDEEGEDSVERGDHVGFCEDEMRCPGCWLLECIKEEK